MTNHRGQSLISTLMGVAIAGLLLVTVSGLVEFGSKGQNNVKYRMDADTFNEEVRALLSSPTACTNSFAGHAAQAGKSYNIVQLRDGSPAPGATRYLTGMVYGDRSLKLRALKLSNFVAGASPDKAQGTLTLDLDSQKESAGAQSVARSVLLNLDLNPATKAITSCIAMAKMSDGIWQRSSANLNNIYFEGSPLSGGNVGIGTANPTAPLDVVGNSATLPGIQISRNANSNYASIGFVPAGAASGTNVVWGIGLASGSNQLFFNSWDGTATTTRVVVQNNGNVGIGTSTPNFPLKVVASNTNYSVASFVGKNPAGASVIFSDPTTTASPGIGSVGNSLTLWSNSLERLRIASSGNVGIGSMSPGYKLDVNGDVNIAAGHALRFGGTSVCTGAGCTSASDESLKENIRPLQDGLERVLRLQGVEYDYKDRQRFTPRHQIGVIAQDVERVYPEVVARDPQTAILSVAYDHLVAPLIEAIKTLYRRLIRIEDDQRLQDSGVAALKADNAAQAKELRELRARLEKIEKMLKTK